MSWACLLSAHRHGFVRPILQGPSGFIFTLFSCPFPLFWSVVIEKEGQMGWRFKKIIGWRFNVQGLMAQMTGLTVTRLMGWRLKTKTSLGVQTSDKLFGSIYGAWHVSFFDWFLSGIEASPRLPCTFPIKTTPFSSHFSTFRRNTLSEHVCHNCQRPIRSIPTSFILIRSLFGSISNFFPFFFFFLLFFFLSFIFLWNHLFSFCAPVTLSKLVNLRFCHYV